MADGVGRFSNLSVAMSLCPQQPIPPLPDDTARVARARMFPLEKAGLHRE